MKRGKDDGKVMGPMFPRLHVNDNEKGGPRAPPRNKMALYEQFSVPSQRFNSGVLPLNPNVSSNTVPPASSSQGTVPERNYVFPGHFPPQKPFRRAEKCNSRQSEGANLSASLEQRKKVDEDDFMVPVYVHSRIGQCNDKSVESFGGKKLIPTGSTYLGGSVARQSDHERDPKQFGSSLVNMRKDVRSEIGDLPQVSTSKEQPLMSVKSISTGENVNNLARQAKVTPNQEFQDCHVSKLNRLRQGDACLPWDSGVGALSNDIVRSVAESARETNKGNALTANQPIPAEAINDTEHHDTRRSSPIKRGNLNKSDNASKISVVENLSTVQISPDDVVGIIG